MTTLSELLANAIDHGCKGNPSGNYDIEENCHEKGLFYRMGEFKEGKIPA